MIEKYDVAKENNYVPLGLINKNTKVKVDIKMGQEITYDMLEMDESSYVYELRKLQDQLYQNVFEKAKTSATAQAHLWSQCLPEAEEAWECLPEKEGGG